MTPRSRVLGCSCFFGVATFVSIVVALHFLQPQFDPANQLMSELALGPRGEWMILAFAGFSLAALSAGIGGLRLTVSRTASNLLIAAAAALLGAGIFPLGSATQIHISLVSIAFVLVVLAMYLVGRRPQSEFGFPNRIISWGLGAGTAFSVAAGNGAIPIGLAQRLAAASILLWFTLVAWQLFTRKTRAL